MNEAGSAGFWQRFDVLEQSMCVRMNRGCQVASLKRFFACVSRLGDGVAWYVLMIALGLSGDEGARVAAQMGATGLVGLVLYRQLKSRLVRERPCVSHAFILAGTAPLDRYSFPSGHTLHAVLFTVIAVAHVPLLAPLLVPFMLLVGASRVVLGLHYPTDVAAGALLGLLLATLSLWLWPV